MVGGFTGEQGVVGEGWLAGYSPPPTLSNIETITDQRVASVDGKTVLQFTKSLTLSDKVWLSLNKNIKRYDIYRMLI